MKNNFSKIFMSFVAIIYVMSTIGVSVFSHYCGGELEKVTLFSKTKKCCGEEEAEMDDGCCKNEIVHIAFQKDFTFHTLNNNVKAPVSQLFNVNPDFDLNSFKYSLISFLSISRKIHPPDLVQQELISCSVIRI